MASASQGAYLRGEVRPGEIDVTVRPGALPLERDPIAQALDITKPAAPADARAPPRVGAGAVAAELPRIGRFYVLDVISEGSEGLVFAAYDESLDRKVAIKVLRPGVPEDALREAQAMARVSHPNIITVHEVGTFEDRLFIAMEFVHGRTMAAWIEAGPHPWREAVERMLQAGRGLAAAHAAGLVHGDFKPANVVIGDDGVVKVLDFGMARIHDPHALVGATLEVEASGGTPAYMAPEQHRGAPASSTSDQFSFCVSLYEALYGQDPFASDSDLLVGRIVDPPPGVRVPVALTRIVRRGLAVDPAQRFPSMTTLLAALAGTVRRRQRRGLVPLGLAAALIGGAVLALSPLAPTSDACDAAPLELHGLWDASAAALVHARLLGTGLTYAEDTWKRVQPRLDAYAAALVERRVEACRAHRDGLITPGLFDLRTACLDQRHVSLAAFVRILQAGDADVVRNATAAAANLPSVATCDDTQALVDVVTPHGDPALEARVAHVREILAEAQAQEMTGQFARGLARIEALELGSVQHPPLLAEVGLRRASLLSELGRHQDAERGLRDALRAALASRHHLAAAAIATRRDFLRAARLQRPGEVLDDGPIVEGLVARAELYSEGAGYRSDHANNLGIAESLLGHQATAQRHFAEALALRRAALGADHPQVVYAMGNLGLSYIESADLDQAVRLLRTALAAAETGLGPSHPHVALLAINLGYAHRTLLQFREAASHLGRALELQTEQLGADSPDLHYVLESLGELAIDQRRCEEATVHYRRAVHLLETGGHGSAASDAVRGLGRAAICAGDHAGAIVLLRRAMKLAEANHGAEEPPVARILAYIGDAQLLAGSVDEAMATYVRAYELLRAKLSPTSSELAEAQRRIAGAHRRRGELAAATAAAERALEIHTAAGVADGLVSASIRALLGELALERGDPTLALQHLERAAGIYTGAAVDPDNDELALVRFAMARALARRAGAPTPEARALAEQALAVLGPMERAYPQELAGLRAWLAQP